LIFSPPQFVEIGYRPSYSEIADADIYLRYQTTENDLIASREGSEYVRRKIAEIELCVRMNQLASLPSNWDTFETERPSQQAIATATMIAESFIKFGLVPDAIVPSAEGGVAVCFLRNQKYADIECLNSGEVLAVRYSSQDDPQAWAIRANIAPDATVQTVSQYLSA
jgi:hypothetical protein